MPIDTELLVKVISSARGKSLTVDDVMVRGGLGEGARPHVRRALRELAGEGRIEADGRRFRSIRPAPAAEAEAPPPGRPTRARPGATGEGGIAAPDTVPAPVLPRPPRPGSGLVVGSLTRHRDGYGFIAPLHGGDDLFVPPQIMGDAMDGDLVEARAGIGRDGRTVARTLEIVERRRHYAIGTYREPRGGRGDATVEPRDTALGHFISVAAERSVNDGDVVRVQLEAFEAGVGRGRVVGRVGLPGDPDVEVLSVAYSEGFSDVFPADTARAAEATPDHVRPEDKIGRRDLTSIDLVTIDGEDARDFDDAVYVERTTRGFRLVVAIADVTHYVTEGGALDREALRRATSVYFPQHVLPMLPERLSNGICSLNPKVERLCMVADMAMDHSARVIDAEIYPGVMLSKARCTYTQVAALVDGKPVPELDHVKPMLLVAAELASKLTYARMARGAIDFDIPEGHVLLGPDNQVAAIVKRARNAAHRLVEEFMLAANEAVARYFESRALPTVYRVHGSPKEAKLRAFMDLAQAFGYDIDVDAAGKVSAEALNQFLARVEGKPEQRALNHLLLRSMMQAAYSAENIGHFGLAAESYLHFTSPIRRYPDLVVHRLLKQHWARGGRVLPEDVREKHAEDLETVAVHCSERERAATSAERDIDAYYAAALLVSRVGERFRGTIASVAQFGLFVELLDPFVEGLVRAETLGGSWELDAEKHRLVVGGGKRSFGIGESVEIEVASADPVLRRIDLRLVENGRVIDVSGGEFARPERPPRRTGGAPAEAPPPSRFGRPKTTGDGRGEGRGDGRTRRAGPAREEKPARRGGGRAKAEAPARGAEGRKPSRFAKSYEPVRSETDGGKRPPKPKAGASARTGRARGGPDDRTPPGTKPPKQRHQRKGR